MVIRQGNGSRHSRCLSSQRLLRDYNALAGNHEGKRSDAGCGGCSRHSGGPGLNWAHSGSAGNAARSAALHAKLRALPATDHVGGEPGGYLACASQARPGWRWCAPKSPILKTMPWQRRSALRSCSTKPPLPPPKAQPKVSCRNCHRWSFGWPARDSGRVFPGLPAVLLRKPRVGVDELHKLPEFANILGTVRPEACPCR